MGGVSDADAARLERFGVVREIGVGDASHNFNPAAAFPQQLTTDD
ncbi:hypothetical protein [Lacipirellula parvula]|uniref:Uncharacterized protein n=1 Tax=Lacipirellula parvula TaxID=2650471 RepID=A0A5K7XC87_9BACT|nr:hypothetical protein [Lacipirellula parvula]BBO34118.1 hypothetical protein PLANPX_3730 [Lacipirellula parvula]